MGRKIQFDKDQALNMAMESFWAMGYSSTSMRSLADSLGLHLGSVYNALGDKESVFEKSFRLNYENCVLPRFEKMARADDPLQALVDFVEVSVREANGDDIAPGCFLINSLVEMTTINEKITALMNGYVAKLEEWLALCIGRAVQQGRLPPATDARDQARFVLGNLFAIRAMGKLKLDKELLHGVKRGMLKALHCA